MQMSMRVIAITSAIRNRIRSKPLPSFNSEQITFPIFDRMSNDYPFSVPKEGLGIETWEKGMHIPYMFMVLILLGLEVN